MDERIILGSGYLYITEFEGGIPKVDDVCKEENLLSLIQGGASLEYKPESYTAVDDMGKVSKTILISEEVVLKSGLMTFCADALKKLCETAKITDVPKSGQKKARRIVKIGGLSKQDGLRYVICFHHVDKVDGDIWVMIVGKSQAGFTLAFAKDKETVVDAEFKAMPQDNDGTLIHYEEEKTADAPAPQTP
jgi:hypothetical protein